MHSRYISFDMCNTYACEFRCYKYKIDDAYRCLYSLKRNAGRYTREIVEVNKINANKLTFGDGCGGGGGDDDGGGWMANRCTIKTINKKKTACLLLLLLLFLLFFFFENTNLMHSNDDHSTHGMWQWSAIVWKMYSAWRELLIGKSFSQFA